MTKGIKNLGQKMQKTLKADVKLSGIGLHSGKEVELTIKPAPVNVGMMFCRLDVKDSESLVAADFRNVTKTMLGTTITNSFGVEVATIEHLMAALWGVGVDNAIIELEGPEIPIMDGSSEPFIAAVRTVGLKTQNTPRKIVKITDEIRVGDKQRYAKLLPADNFAIRFDISFEESVIPQQRARYEFDDNTFVNEISRARTFGFKHEVDALHAAGLARGGSLENAIVLDEGRVLNKEGLRFEDELVRHKILDSVGDLYLIGARIEGEFIGYRSGHSTNNEILRTLMENEKAWEIHSFDEEGIQQVAPQAFQNLGAVTA